MFKIELQWKEINIDLEKIDAKLKLDFPNNYKGNQAHSVLDLYFESELSSEEKESIVTYWESLDEESEEALSYRSASNIHLVKKTLKEGLLAKSWDQMSLIERKAMMGMDVSKQELIDAELL